MAYAPCSIHGGRFLGKAAHVYPAVADGANWYREKLRLCPQCSTGYQLFLAGYFVRADDEGSMPLPAVMLCVGCGDACEDGSTPVFVTAYWPGQERMDYFGIAHKDCGREAALRTNAL